MTQIICPVCSNTESIKTFTAKERLIWTREIFNYWECSLCKCVFLVDEIKDFSPYYPEWYHCFDDTNYPSWKKFLLKKLYMYNFRGKWSIGRVTNILFTKIHWYKPEQNICRVSTASKHILWKVDKNSIKWLSVLDLWCWSWQLLQQLETVGFKDLTWVEPFWKPSSSSITFISSNLHDYLSNVWDKKYDIIIMSHVLEHLYDHHSIMTWLKNILSTRWVIIIAMPFTGKLFDKFREYTMSLDAPRHVIMHSTSSFRWMIINKWLHVLDEWYEQKGRDIFASEMYSRDIWFSEIKKMWLRDHQKKEHAMIANAYNKQKQWWSHVTFFITH